jgi:hypothetical protein
MRRVLTLVVLALCLSSVARAQVVESLREQIKVREALLQGQLDDVQQARQQLQELWTRLDQQLAAMLRAQREGETVDSLRLRDQELRQIETEIAAALGTAQAARRSMLENRTMLAAYSTEVERLAAAVGAGEELLTGTWQLIVEPGQEGMAVLQQQGTLVTGTYALSGGFSGSFRGTLVAGKVRLERIDSQIGFAAIFYGRVIGQGRNLRMQGNWEATQLASGLPSTGDWTARKLEEAP